MSLDKSRNVPSVAVAFTPLWPAAGGLLGPAFMPGFRRCREPSWASPEAAIARRFAEPETARRLNRPRRRAGSVDTLWLGRHPQVHGRQHVLKHNGSLKLSVCLGLVMLVCGKSYADRHEPRFMTMASQYQRVAKQRPVLRFPGRDKGLKHTLFLLSDRMDQPLLFYSDITTPVCNDNLCKPVTIGLYWDLVGNYVGYGVPAECPLTKYDDVRFEPADYMKLHQVLMDRQSILGRTTMADMFDPNAPTDARNLTARGQTVDAVSGATAKAFRPSIVPGALYSCHTIWHLANRELRQPMVDYLMSIYSPTVARRFLHSANEDYQLHAVQQLDRAQLTEHLPRVLEIVQGAEPVTRAYILKQLPGSIWQQESTTRSLYSLFAELDVDMKALLITKLDQAHASAAEILADQVETMTKNQLKGYLAFLAHDSNRLNQTIEAKLRRIAAAERYAYCYVVEAFLRD